MELFISEALKEDAKIIIDYLNQVGGESHYLTFGKDECHINEFQEMEIIEDYQKSHNSVMLLGFIEDELVALASLSGMTKKRLCHNVELGVSVKKEYWNMGIASMMMEELIDYAKNHQIVNINLEVFQENASAIHLYHKFGFQDIGVLPQRFYIDKKYYDTVLMNLSLTY